MEVTRLSNSEGWSAHVGSAEVTLWKASEKQGEVKDEVVKPLKVWTELTISNT